VAAVYVTVAISIPGAPRAEKEISLRAFWIWYRSEKGGNKYESANNENIIVVVSIFTSFTVRTENCPLFSDW